MSERVLLVDDDADLRRFLESHLALEGFEVTTAVDGAAALGLAVQDPPDLVVLDTGPDDVEVVRRLRAHPLTAALPVIVLSGRGLAAERAAAPAAGADDCVAKPFDVLELVARVRSTLRRTADVRAVSPLTGLPGNHRIDAEIAGRAASGDGYAVCHVDLDEFKAFNDVYGFARGDELLRLLATCLQAAAGGLEPAPFVGHVGGDDFVVVCAPGQAEVVCGLALAQFDQAVPDHYDADDAARGWLDVPDRRGTQRRHPLVTVSVGVAVQDGPGRDPRAVVTAAGEMKTVAKGRPGSHVAVDRRS